MGCRVSDTASPTALVVASHADNGGPQPSVGSVTASSKDTRLSRNEEGSSDSATDLLRKGLASSSSATMIRITRAPSPVLTPAAVGVADEPRWTRTTPMGAFVSMFENRNTAPAARRVPPQLNEAVVSVRSATF